MGASQQSLLMGGGGIITDPQFANVALLLHGNGTNGGTTITDSSSNARTPASQTNITTVTAQALFGSTSLAFPASAGTDYLNYTTGFTSLFAGDFTLEAFVKTSDSSNGTHAIFSWTSGGNSWEFYIASGQLRLWNSSLVIANAGALTTSTGWVHVALTRASNIMYAYLAGVYGGQFSQSGSLSPTASFNIGRYAGGGENWVGWMDDVRITDGVARYSGASNFTPPSAEFPNS